jgi:hypothetical protein
MPSSAVSPLSRAILKARELESAMQTAVRKLEAAKALVELREAEELAAKAADLAKQLEQAVALFAASIKSEVAVRRPRTLW